MPQQLPENLYAIRNGTLDHIEISGDGGYDAVVSRIQQWLPKAAKTIGGKLAPDKTTQIALENYLPFSEVNVDDNFWRYQVTALRGNFVKTSPHINSANYIIYIPYVAGIELLQKAVLSAVAPNRNIWVVDSSAAGLDTSTDWLDQCSVLRLPYETTFTQMHNTVIKYATNLNATYLLFMHSDAELADSDVVPELIANMEFNTAVAFTNYDALACFNMAAFRDIGFWDETFPQYASDCDYFYRVNLSPFWRTKQTALGSRVSHFTAVTIKTNDPLRVKWNTSWVLAHYAHKWGGLPSHESLKSPYGLARA